MDKRTLLAIVLSMAVIFLYSKFILPPPMPVPQPAPEQPAREDVASGPERAVEELPEGVRPSLPETKELEEVLAKQESAPSREVRISNGLFDITMTSRGAAVKSWKLTQFLDSEGQSLEIVPATGERDLLPLSVIFHDPDLTSRFSLGNYLSEDSDIVLGERNPEDTVVFTRTDQATGLSLTKKLTFHHDSYMVDISMEISNLGGETQEIPHWLFWGPGLGRGEEGKGRFFTGALAYDGAKARKMKPKEDRPRMTVPAGIKWLGLTDRYFLASFIPAGEKVDGIVTWHDKATYGIGLGPDPRSVFPRPGEKVALESDMFVGPKSYSLLKGYGLGLERSIDFGWFGWLGIPLLKTLKFFYKYVGNYGLAIILMTILIKIILAPVTFKMYSSMRRMSDLQPQMQAIRKKYKDDPQLMNQKTMELYRQNKVNPLGGCLPMFIQIPVFFALYKVLYISIELRGASFLHIDDLSGPEPGILGVKILVVLMGGTMFIQQRISPTAGDPRQAKFMMFMPFLFTALFWNFSSGLVVYFLFSNILAIGEQMLIKKRFAPKPVEVPEEEAPEPVKKLPSERKPPRRRKKKK